MKNIEKSLSSTSYFDTISASSLGEINQQEYLEKVIQVLKQEDIDEIISMYETTISLIKKQVEFSGKLMGKISEIFTPEYLKDIFTQISNYDLSKLPLSKTFYEVIKNKIGEEEYTFLIKKSYIRNKWTQTELVKLQCSKRVKSILEFEQCYETGKFEQGLELYKNVLIKQGYHKTVQEGIDITKLNILRKLPNHRTEFFEFANVLEQGSENAQFEAKLNKAYVYMESGEGQLAEQLFKELIIMKKEKSSISGRKDRLYSGMIFNYFKNGFGERTFLERAYQKLKYFASKFKCSNKTLEAISLYERNFGV